MATKTKSTSVKRTTLNSSIVNATKAAIDTTVENTEKWQKLTKKLIKKSEPIRKTQLNMVFDTATAVKNQVNSGTERMIDLVGYDNAMVVKAVKFAKMNPVSKKVMDVAEDIMEKVSENPIVKKVEKTTEGFKKMGTAKINDVKKDVLMQAHKILNKGEAIVEGAMDSKTTKKQSKTKTTAKVKKTGKTVSAKVTKVTKKVTPKTAVAKPAVKAVVKETKTVTTKKVTPVEKEVKVAVAVKTVEKDDLKIIYGIGPKLESILHKNGIVTYADLAKADKTKIETIIEQAGPLFKNVNTTDWKKQAEVGAAEGTEALVKWVARYRTA